MRSGLRRPCLAVTFGTDADRLLFPRAWLAIENCLPDPPLWLIAQERIVAAERRLEQTDPAGQIRTLVSGMLTRDGRVPRLKQMAAETGMSARSIVRLLADAGTSYHRLVDQERRLRAAELIADPLLSIRQIAGKLGFPDSSGFGRKFKDWFGESPARFRRPSTSC